MASTTLEGIALTLNRLATPGMTPKELMKAVRETHPDASKKDVVRAAFYAVISHSGEDAERSDRLHDFALGARTDLADGPDPKEKKRKARPKH